MIKYQQASNKIGSQIYMEQLLKPKFVCAIYMYIYINDSAINFTKTMLSLR